MLLVELISDARDRVRSHLENHSIDDGESLELQVARAVIGWADALLEINAQNPEPTVIAQRASEPGRCHAWWIPGRSSWDVGPMPPQALQCTAAHGGQHLHSGPQDLGVPVDQLLAHAAKGNPHAPCLMDDEIEQAAVQRLANALRWNGSVEERGPIRGERLVRLLAQAEQLVPVPEELNPALSDDEQQAWRALSARHAAEITELRAEENARRNPPTPTPHWMYSSTEEVYSGGSTCESRDEAISEALHELDLVAGDRFWTGVTDKIISEDLADRWGSAEQVIEAMEGFLYDELGGELGGTEMRVSDAQRVELDQEVTAVVRRWLDRYQLEAPCWRIAKAQCHIAKDCECTRSTPEGLGDDRCKICGGCGLVLDVEESDATP